MAEQPRGKCEVVGGILAPCAGLESMIEGDYVDRRGTKGLFSVTILDFSGNGYPFAGYPFARSGVVLCCGERGERGVVLQYCPICGASIGHHLRSKVVAEAVTADA